MLGYANSRDALRKHVEKEDKTTVAICDSGSNYKTQAVFINESGLYSLILSSKLPTAREFKHWVTGVVLPQIRKTGGYIPVDREDDDLTIMTIGEWFDSLEVRYNDGQLTEAEADLSHRCGEFMLRAAIPLVALYGQETKEIVDFCRWVGETAHYNLCHIFGPRVQRDLLSSEKLLADTSDARRTVVPLLNKMADVFTVKELQEQRRKDGQSDYVRMLLSRYCKNGKLIRIGRGVFRKAECNIVTVTKMRDPNVTN